LRYTSQIAFKNLNVGTNTTDGQTYPAFGETFKRRSSERISHNAPLLEDGIPKEQQFVTEAAASPSNA